MYTRSETKERSFGHVIQCDIEESLSAVISLRKHNKWFYIAVDPEDIENDHLRGQYERRASACRRQQIAYLKLINGEDDNENAETKDREGQETDSGYSSDEASPGDADAEDIFRDWIQQPLQQVFDDHAPKNDKEDQKSLQQWYETDIFCFSITSGPDESELHVAPRNDLDGEAYLRDSITPNMPLPKYIKERKDIEWYSPGDIEVLAESHDIHMPMHPTIVRVRTSANPDDHKTCFLKLAAKGQEPAVKRELKLLADFQKKDLYTKGIRAPVLEGLVSLPSTPSTHSHTLGFLLSLIPQPSRPLTKLMTSEISPSKRQRWASEAQNQVRILHANGFLWGDAKADNFLVDARDELWIIDFGGSYTVGWMDPRKYLTEKGEDEAVRLIVDGVQDPDRCAGGLVGETEETPPSQLEEAREGRREERRAKRKLGDGDDAEEVEESDPKRRK